MFSHVRGRIGFSFYMYGGRFKVNKMEYTKKQLESRRKFLIMMRRKSEKIRQEELELIQNLPSNTINNNNIDNN